jgi:hypothetical protein
VVSNVLCKVRELAAQLDKAQSGVTVFGCNSAPDVEPCFNNLNFCRNMSQFKTFKGGDDVNNQTFFRRPTSQTR